MFSTLNNKLSIICRHVAVFQYKTGLFEFWQDHVYQTKNRIINRKWKNLTGHVGGGGEDGYIHHTSQAVEHIT